MINTILLYCFAAVCFVGGGVLLVAGMVALACLLLEWGLSLKGWRKRRAARQARLAREQKALSDGLKLRERAHLTQEQNRRLRRLLHKEPYLLHLCNLRPNVRVVVTSSDEPETGI